MHNNDGFFDTQRAGKNNCRRYVSNGHPFQFSEFYDPDLNQSTTLPTFFIYRHVFFNDVIVSVFHIYIFK